MEYLKPTHCFSVHDLLRLRSSKELIEIDQAAPWVEDTLARNPWVVVRRMSAGEGIIAVGVRGENRSQRFAASVVVAGIISSVSPEELSSSRDRLREGRRREIPALAAMDRVAPLLTQCGYRWGPGGSVGFEIATGTKTATASSDLDLILSADRRIETHRASELLIALEELASPARVDVILETPYGGVALAELAEAREQFLIRTANGPRLVVDPWLADSVPFVGAS